MGGWPVRRMRTPGSRRRYTWPVWPRGQAPPRWSYPCGTATCAAPPSGRAGARPGAALHPRQDQKPRIHRQQVASRAAGLQPMTRSRIPSAPGAEPHAKRATERPAATTSYQHLPADAGDAVNPAANIDGVDRDQDPHPGRDLDHAGAPATRRPIRWFRWQQNDGHDRRGTWSGSADLHQSSRFRDRATASPRIARPQPASARASGQKVSSPTPFRKMPRTMTR